MKKHAILLHVSRVDGNVYNGNIFILNGCMAFILFVSYSGALSTNWVMAYYTYRSGHSNNCSNNLIHWNFLRFF